MVHEWLLRMGMMIHHVQRISAILFGILGFPTISSRKQKILQNLNKVNVAIEACYHNIRDGLHGPHSEEFYLRRIRVLEDYRFQLLEQLNGHEIEEYNTLPLKVV